MTTLVSSCMQLAGEYWFKLEARIQLLEFFKHDVPHMVVAICGAG